MTAPDTSTDAELVARAAAGDRTAFTTLFRRHVDTVHDHVARWCRDSALAGDATQEAFVALLDRLDTLRDGQAVLAWLLRTARNRAIDQLRRTGRERTTTPLDDGGIPSAVLTAVDEDRAGSPERAAEANDAAGWLWEVASGLDERTFTVLDLTVRHGLSGPELAAVLDTTPANANVLTFRMRERVRTLFGGVAFLRADGRACAGLAAIQEGLADPLDLAGARRLEAHAEDCRACADRRRRAVAPLRAYAAFADVRAPDTVQAEVEDAVERHVDPQDGPRSDAGTRVGWTTAVARAAVVVTAVAAAMTSLAAPTSEPTGASAVVGVTLGRPQDTESAATSRDAQGTTTPTTDTRPTPTPRTAPPRAAPPTTPTPTTPTPTTPTPSQRDERADRPAVPPASTSDEPTPDPTPSGPATTDPPTADRGAAEPLPSPADPVPSTADPDPSTADPDPREPDRRQLVVAVTAPADGSRIATTPELSASMRLAASVTGADPATTTVAWRSDLLAGVVLRTLTGSIQLPGRRGCDPFVHRLTVTATSSDGRTATDAVVVELVPTCPTLSVRITAPADGAVVPTDDRRDPASPTATLVATGETAGGAGGERYVWRSDHVAAPLLTGRSGRIRLAAASCRATTHMVTVRVTDPATGAVADASATVTVRPTC